MFFNLIFKSLDFSFFPLKVTLICRLKVQITLNWWNILVHIDIKVQSLTWRKAEVRGANLLKAIQSRGRADVHLNKNYESLKNLFDTNRLIQMWKAEGGTGAHFPCKFEKLPGATILKWLPVLTLSYFFAKIDKAVGNFKFHDITQRIISFLIKRQGL